MSLTHNDRSITTNTLTHSVMGSGIIMTQRARQLFCGVGWKCPISEERLCEFQMCFNASSVGRNVILPRLWISQMCYTLMHPFSSLCLTDSCLCRMVRLLIPKMKNSSVPKIFSQFIKNSEYCQQKIEVLLNVMHIICMHSQKLLSSKGQKPFRLHRQQTRPISAFKVTDGNVEN